MKFYNIASHTTFMGKTSQKGKLKNRHRLRRKEAQRIVESLVHGFGIRQMPEKIEEAYLNDEVFYISAGEVFAMVQDGKEILTLKGVLRYSPQKRYVVVDEGAVPYLYNGADVMSPGIVQADPEIVKGDVVWVKEEKHGKPLVVGIALLSGQEMVKSVKGKAIKTLHHLNDEIWNLEI